jgi:hypothetical protein
MIFGRKPLEDLNPNRITNVMNYIIFRNGFYCREQHVSRTFTREQLLGQWSLKPPSTVSLPLPPTLRLFNCIIFTLIWVLYFGSIQALGQQISIAIPIQNQYPPPLIREQSYRFPLHRRSFRIRLSDPADRPQLLVECSGLPNWLSFDNDKYQFIAERVPEVRAWPSLQVSFTVTASLVTLNETTKSVSSKLFTPPQKITLVLADNIDVKTVIPIETQFQSLESESELPKNAFFMESGSIGSNSSPLLYFPMESLPFRIALSPKTFSSSQNSSMEYNLFDEETLEIPNWIDWNPQDLSMVIRKPSSLRAQSKLVLVASSIPNWPGGVQTMFYVKVGNLLPTLRNLEGMKPPSKDFPFPIMRLMTKKNSLFQLDLNTMFQDEDTLSFYVASEASQRMPPWINLDANGTLSGIPQWSVVLNVSALDIVKEQMSILVKIIVDNHEPLEVKQECLKDTSCLSISAAVGHAWAWTIPKDVFLGSDELSFTTNIHPTLSWISFNPDENLLYGTPTQPIHSSISIEAKDAQNSTAWVTAQVSVLESNSMINILTLVLAVASGLGCLIFIFIIFRYFLTRKVCHGGSKEYGRPKPPIPPRESVLWTSEDEVSPKLAEENSLEDCSMDRSSGTFKATQQMNLNSRYSIPYNSPQNLKVSQNAAKGTKSLSKVQGPPQTYMPHLRDKTRETYHTGCGQWYEGAQQEALALSPECFMHSYQGSILECSLISRKHSDSSRNTIPRTSNLRDGQMTMNEPSANIEVENSSKRPVIRTELLKKCLARVERERTKNSTQEVPVADHCPLSSLPSPASLSDTPYSTNPPQSLDRSEFSHQSGHTEPHTLFSMDLLTSRPASSRTTFVLDIVDDYIDSAYPLNDDNVMPEDVAESVVCSDLSSRCSFHSAHEKSPIGPSSIGPHTRDSSSTTISGEESPCLPRVPLSFPQEIGMMDPPTRRLIAYSGIPFQFILTLPGGLKQENIYSCIRSLEYGMDPFMYKEQSQAFGSTEKLGSYRSEDLSRSSFRDVQSRQTIIQAASDANPREKARMTYPNSLGTLSYGGEALGIREDHVDSGIDHSQDAASIKAGLAMSLQNSTQLNLASLWLSVKIEAQNRTGVLRGLPSSSHAGEWAVDIFEESPRQLVWKGIVKVTEI